MLRGSPVGDDIDRGGVDEIIAIFSRFLLERVHEDLKISVRDLPDEFSGRIVVQIDHHSAPVDYATTPPLPRRSGPVDERQNAVDDG